MSRPGRSTPITRTLRRGGPVARGAVDAARAAGRLEIEDGIGGAQDRPAQPAYRAALAGEEVGVVVPGPAARLRRRGGQRGPHAPERVRGEDDAVRAREADGVRGAAGEDAQLARQRGRALLEHVEAPARGAAPVGGGGKRAQAGVVARAAVVERGGGDVADAPACGKQAALPLLLVAVQLAALVEAPGGGDRGAPDGHVRAPGRRDVAVGGAVVLGRDGRILAAAGPQAVVLEAGADRAGQHADVGRRALVCRDQRGEPAGLDLDVVVDEDEQVRGGRVDAGVAGGVESSRCAVGDVAGAVAQRGRLRVAVRPVVDDDDLGSGRGRLRRDRRQRDLEVARSQPRRHDDARRRGHDGGV